MPRKAKTLGASKRALGPTFIKAWRESLDQTQEQLAAAVAEISASSFSASALSRIENGKGPYNQWQLEALATALRCTPADLLERDPSETDSPWQLWGYLSQAQRRTVKLFIKAAADERKQEAA